MADDQETASTSADAGKRYHHGDLREALVAACREQIAEKGVEKFTIADACRAIGVSTAAPYRHFPDRLALMEAICADGFKDLTRHGLAARDKHPPGSIESLIALGKAYMAYGAAEPEMFHIMWGRIRDSEPEGEAAREGACSFGMFIETLETVKAAQGLDHVPTEELALMIWSLPHGLTHLKQNNKTDMLPGADPEAVLDQATRALFAGLARRPTEAGTQPDTDTPADADTTQ